MTKSARLFFIVDQLRQGKSFSVTDLASICHISQRTVFRDIRDLQKLQVPIYFADGYRLRQSGGIQRPTIDQEGFEILRFALRASPLAGISGFDKKLKSLETKLRKLSGSSARLGCPALSHRLEAEGPGARKERNALNSRESRLISLLWKRSLTNLPLSLTLKSNPSRKALKLSGRAESLVWRNGRWALYLRHSKPSRRSCLNIDQISSVQLPSDNSKTPT